MAQMMIEVHLSTPDDAVMTLTLTVPSGDKAAEALADRIRRMGPIPLIGGISIFVSDPALAQLLAELEAARTIEVQIQIEAALSADLPVEPGSIGDLGWRIAISRCLRLVEGDVYLLPDGQNLRSLRPLLERLGLSDKDGNDIVTAVSQMRGRRHARHGGGLHEPWQSQLLSDGALNLTRLYRITRPDFGDSQEVLYALGEVRNVGPKRVGLLIRFAERLVEAGAIQLS